MSVVPGVMQVLGFEAQESAHPFESALVREALSFEGAEQFFGVEHEYAFGRSDLWYGGGEPVNGCLDGFRFEVTGRGESKTESLCSWVMILTRCLRDNHGK